MPASGEQPLQHIGQSWHTPWIDVEKIVDLTGMIERKGSTYQVIRPARISPWNVIGGASGVASSRKFASRQADPEKIPVLGNPTVLRIPILYVFPLDGHNR